MSKFGQKKGIIKIRAEINEMYTRKTIEKNEGNKALFFVCLFVCFVLVKQMFIRRKKSTCEQAHTARLREKVTPS